MELALTFGSFGDLLALGILVKDIIVCLDDCRGSSKEYQDLVQSLTILGSVIQEVDLIFRSPRRVTAAPRLCESASKSIAQIQQTLKSFNEKLQKFRPSLTPGGSGNRIKNVARKIQFKMDDKDIAKFKGEVTGYTVALRMLMEAMALEVYVLSLAFVHCIDLQNFRYSLDQNHDEVIKTIAAAGSETQQETKRELESTRRTLMSSVTGIGRQLLEKVASLTQATLEIRQSASQIASTVLSLSLELSSFRLLLTSFQQRAPEDRYYFTIQDALGREFPIHLNTITSWDAFAFVLSEKFKGVRGARRVRNRRYRLIELATRREINQSKPWEKTFLPHQRIVMSLLCKDAEAKADETSGGHLATCPWCKTQSDSDTSTQVQCQGCNMFFTRVVELEDMVLPPQPSTGWKAPEFGRVSFDVQLPPDWERAKKRRRNVDDSWERAQKRVKYDSLGNRKRSRDEDEDGEMASDDEDVNGLVRVTVVSRRKRIKVFQMPKQGLSTPSFQQFTPPVVSNWVGRGGLIGGESVWQEELFPRHDFAWTRGESLGSDAVESSDDGQEMDDSQDTDDDQAINNSQVVGNSQVANDVQVMDNGQDTGEISGTDDGRHTYEGHYDDSTDEDESVGILQRTQAAAIHSMRLEALAKEHPAIPNHRLGKYLDSEEGLRVLFHGGYPSLCTNIQSPSLYTIIQLANRSQSDYQYNQIRHIAWQLFRTVAFLHEPDIVDLTLSTKSKTAQFSMTDNYPHPHSRPNSYMYSMDYLAPEQLLGLEPKSSADSEAADIWSVGCIIVDLLLLARDALSDSQGSQAPGPPPCTLFGLLAGLHEHLAVMEKVCGAKLGESLVAHAEAERSCLFHGAELAMYRSSRVDGAKTLNQILYSTIRGFGSNSSLWRLHSQIFYLLPTVLTLDPRKRITAKEALAHPWFRGIKDPREEGEQGVGAATEPGEEGQPKAKAGGG